MISSVESSFWLFEKVAFTTSFQKAKSYFQPQHLYSNFQFSFFVLYFYYMDYSLPTNQYTAELLERMYFNLPPLVPESVVIGLKTAMADVEADGGKPVSDIEDVIIVFSKKIWPYTQAFEELCNRYEKELGEKLMSQKASYVLRRALEHYRQTGGTWLALYSGAVASMFTPEERVELHQLLVDIRCDVRAFAAQAAVMTDRAWYEERVEYYQELFGKIQTQLDTLRDLAESEIDHPQLAAEIQDHIRGFEFGLAKLGPQFDYEALCNAHEHFQGRKRDFKIRV